MPSTSWCPSDCPESKESRCSLYTVPHVVEVWGDFACFSRPEMKVERYSYPCPTPSARGVFEAIYFKPQFYWQVSRIEMLSSPALIALRRNEVKEKLNAAAAQNWMSGKARPNRSLLMPTRALPAPIRRTDAASDHGPAQSAVSALRGSYCGRVSFAQRPLTSSSCAVPPRQVLSSAVLGVPRVRCLLHVRNRPTRNRRLPFPGPRSDVVRRLRSPRGKRWSRPAVGRLFRAHTGRGFGSAGIRQRRSLETAASRQGGQQCCRHF